MSLLLLIINCSVVPALADSNENIAHSAASEFLPVQAGCFLMGNGFGDGYFIEMPVHEVCVSSFMIDKFPVTRGAFKKFVEDSGYRTEAEQGAGCYVYDGSTWKNDVSASWRSPGFVQEEDHPVVCVSWNDAAAYARWLSDTTKRTYRLPREAEWEYAARSGGKFERYAGGDTIETVAWYSGNSGHRTHPVGQKKANGIGIYDMSGNVWQWTSDWYDKNYYRESPRNNPKGPLSGTKRIFRGGSWFYDPRGARTTYRDFHYPGYSSSHVGFRLVSPVQ